MNDPTEARSEGHLVLGQWFRRSFSALAAFFFVLMLVLPTTFQWQRGVILAVLVAVGVLAAGRLWLVSRDILLLWLLTTCVGIFGILWGLLNGAPGAIQVSTVYLVWPMVYMLFVGFSRRPKTVIFFEKALVVGIAIATLMTLALLIGTVFDRREWIIDVLAFQSASIGFSEGSVELKLLNLGTVIYGMPFLTALFFLPNSGAWFRRRGVLGLLLLLVFAVCIVSGRRAFWLLALATPLFVWGIFSLAGVRFRSRYLAVTSMFILVIALGAAVGLGIDFGVLSEKFLSAFDFSGEESASLRHQQFTALMSGWSDSPILGQGLGAAEKSMVRSEEMAWAYELSYVALLFQTGLLGFIAYTAAVMWIFYTGVHIVRQRPEAAHLVLPLLVGLAGFLLVNGTNPYLSKFDYLWTIFLPIAAINVYRVGRWT
ncbi:MAG: hypothetical protein ACR2RD_12650 [Woeseiaceae bacterium]